MAVVSDQHQPVDQRSVSVAQRKDPAKAEWVTEWAPRVRWPLGDDSEIMNEWTGTPSQDEQWTRHVAAHMAAQVPGATGSVVHRLVSRTPWVDGDA
jgi:hypothetical protein